MQSRIFIAAMMASMALAGCLSDDEPDDGKPGYAGTPTINAADRPVWVLDQNGIELGVDTFDGELPVFEQRFITNRRSGEPTVGVTSSGAVYYAAIEFDAVGTPTGTSLPRTFYFRSYDAGLNWDDVTPDLAGTAPLHPESGDPYIHVDPDTDRIFAVDMSPNVACNKVAYSDDDGDTWVVGSQAACPFPVADHPTLFTGPKAGAAKEAIDEGCGPLSDFTGCPDLYPNTVYLCSNQVAQAKCAYSNDGGHTWNPGPLVFPGSREGANDPAYWEPCTEPPADPSDPFGSSEPCLNEGLDAVCSGFTSHGTTDRDDGTVYVPRALCGQPYLSVSTDGGVTYEYGPVTPDEPEYLTEPGVHDTMVAVDESGTLYYFWLGHQGTTANLMVSEDKGQTWSDVYNVTAPGVTAAKFPGITAGADGRIAFLYVATTNPRGHAVGNNLYEEDGSKNATNHPIWENATWDAYVGVSIDADSNDPVFAVTTINHMDDPLKRGACVDRCHGDDGGMYDFLDIEIDPVTGEIYAALVDVCNDECENDPNATADYYQRATGDLGVQLAGPTLWDGTEADR